MGELDYTVKSHELSSGNMLISPMLSLADTSRDSPIWPALLIALTW
jgi:hypothetical protein